MQRSILIAVSIVFLLLSKVQLYSQVNDCVGAEVICDNGLVSSNSSGSGLNDFANPNNDQGCILSGEHSSSWYYFEFTPNMPSNSTIEITIAPNGSSIEDFDFSIYGPFVDCDSLGAPIRCSYASPNCAFCPMTGLGNGAEDTSEGAAGDGFLAPLVVQPGQGFFLMVDNWLASSNGFNLTWSGSASNFLNCNANPDCPIEVDAGEDLITCVNPEPIQLNGNALNTEGQIVYNWIGEDPTHTSFLDNPSSASPILNVPNGFFDTITYTLIVADNICTSFDQVSIIVSNEFAPQIQTPELYCENTEYTFNAGVGFDSYLWSTGSTASSITVSDEGTYSVTVTSIGGCVSVSEVTLADPLPAPPQPNIQGDTTICIGSAVTLWAGGGYSTYNWNFGHINPGAIVDEGGTYIVTVTNEIGCEAVDSIVIEQLEAIATPLNIGANREICYNEVLNLDPGSNFAEYEWSDFSTGQTISIDSAGLYCLTVTDMNGCKSSDCIVISEVTTPILELEGNPFYCESGTTIGVADNFEQYWWSNGSNETSIYVTEPGSYSVTVENEGCQDTLQVNIVDNKAISPEIDGPLYLCDGAPTTLNVFGDYASYAWSNGTNASSATLNQLGNYSLSIVDHEGCTDAINFTIGEGTIPVPEIIGDEGICPGDASTLSSYGFDFYEWSTGESESFINITESGTYTLTARDSTGCPGSNTITVEVYDTPALELTGGDFYCSGEFVVMGTTGNYDSYLWSDGTTGPTTNVASPGFHGVTVADDNGCVQQDSVEIEVRPLPTVNVSGPTVVCEGDSIILEASGVFSAYSWSTGDTTATTVVTEAGIYVLEATNEEGCSDKAVYGVQQFESPQPIIQGIAEVCGGSTANLMVEPIYTSYLWSNGSTSNSATINSTGQVFVTVTNSDGCEGIASIEVIQSSLIQLDISGSERLCDGVSTLLDAGNGFDNYEWSTGATTATIEINSPDTYSVTVTNTDGCTGEASITVLESELSPPQIDGVLSFCEGGSTLISVNDSNLEFEWSTGGTGSSLEVTTPGPYSVTVTDQYGCQEENEVVISLETLPEINLPESVAFCEGTTIDLDAGSNYDTYEWSTTESGQIISVSSGGIYIVTGSDTQGCLKMDTVEVEMISAPDFQINDYESLTCTIDSVALSPIINQPLEGLSFQWQDAFGQAIAAEDELEIIVTQSGNYQLYILDNSTGCSDTEIAEVIDDEVLPLANAGPTASLNCHSDQALLTGSGSSIGQDFILEWSTPNGNILTASTEATILIDEPGTYILTVLDTSNDCVQTDEVVVEQFEAPSALDIISRVPVCRDNGEGYIEVSGIEGGRAPFYYSIDDRPFEEENIFENLNSGLYNISILDADNCIFSTEVLIEPSSPLNLTLGENISIKYGEEITLEPITNKTQEDIVSFEWRGTHPMSCTDCWEPEVSPEATAVYSLTVEDINGCRETSQVNVLVSKPRDSLRQRPLVLMEMEIMIALRYMLVQM